MFRKSAITFVGMTFMVGAVNAGDCVSHAVQVKIMSKLAAIGCVGDSDDISRRIVVTSKGNTATIYKIEDVTCNDGRDYDIRMDSRYRVIDKRPS